MLNVALQMKKKQQRNGEKIDIIIVDQKGAYFHISLSMILHHVWN